MFQQRRRRGSNAVEFVLIAPVLFAILGGTMEYGWFFFNQILLDSAAREGARAGARTPADDVPGPLDVAEQASIDFWDGLQIPGTPNFEAEVVTSAGKDLIVVEALLDYPALVGLTPAPDQVKARVAVRHEL